MFALKKKKKATLKNVVLYIQHAADNGNKFDSPFQ